MKRLITFVVLLISWLVIFGILTYLTQLIMVPWDSAIIQPESNTWQRTLNDFFANMPGYYLFSATFLVMSIGLSWKLLRGRTTNIFKLVLGNLIFAFLLIGILMPAAFINNALFFPYPADVIYDPTYRGFHRSIFPAVCIGLACGLWLYWQVRLRSSMSPVT
ncbi:MAG: hypothetical protein RLP44_25125 [Aggregatilineales bacterium]